MADLIGHSKFVNLEPLVQERLFAPCCLSSEQLWAEGFEWSGDEIDDTVVKPTLKRLSEVRNESVESMQRRLGYGDPRELLNNTLLEGDEYAVEFLAWYLQKTLDGVHCKLESDSNDSEPDVSVFHHDVHSCNVELKRIVSATNVRKYADGFVGKEWQRYDPRHPSILLFVFPLLSVDAWRAERLTTGYHDFCEGLDDWHTNSMHPRIVAAPLEVEDDMKELPLRRAANIVDEFVP